MFHDDGIHTFLANFLFAYSLLAGESQTSRSPSSLFFYCAEYGSEASECNGRSITQIFR